MKIGKLYFLMLGFLFYLSIGFGVTSIQRFRISLTDYYQYRVNIALKIVEDLKDRLAPGDKIQTFFYSCDATHALFLLKSPRQHDLYLLFTSFM